LRQASDKFRSRFEHVEAIAAKRNIDLHAVDLATLDALWDEAKLQK
jgi:tetrapyrrole methylase family protein/MazG family protein